MDERQRILDGRYELIREIGTGGFSRANLAKDLRLGRHVVAKIMRRELAHDPASRQRFEREARIAASVSGPNIVEIYDFGTVDGQPVIISQWIDGVDLSRVIRKGIGLRASDSIAILLDVLNGLETLHRAGIQHRDVKPSNILLPKWDAPAKLTDFGISRSQFEPRLTVPGQVLGSPAYMSPEQVDGLELSSTTDIYSASVVLFELVTGSVPFDGETASQVMIKHLQSSPPMPRDINPEVPKALERVILTGLSKSPDSRFSSARTMADALRRIEIDAKLGTESPDVLASDDTVVVEEPFGDRKPENRLAGEAHNHGMPIHLGNRGRKRGFERVRKGTPYRKLANRRIPRRRSWIRRRIRSIPKYPVVLMLLVVLTILILAVSEGV